MLKRVTYTICLFFVTIIVHSQEDYGTDSLKNELRSAKTDTAELILLGSIAYNYAELNPDSAFYMPAVCMCLQKNEFAA